MNDLKTTALVVVTLAILFIPAAGASEPSRETATQETGMSAPVNVLLTFRLGALEDGARKGLKSYQLIAVSGGTGSRLLNGERVPLPTTSKPKDASDGTTSYIYQNIGFSTEVNVWVLADGRVKLMANIESSRIGEEVAGKPAAVITRQLSADAILTPGTPLELTRVEGTHDKSGFVEVEATVLP